MYFIQEVEKLEGILSAGEVSLSCKFTLVFSNTKVVLRKCKISCTKPEKIVKISDYKISSKAGMVFTLSMTISKTGKGKLTKANIQKLTTTTPPATAPSTTEVLICPSGYTVVCGEATKMSSMTAVCPAEKQAGVVLEDECSCLPTRGVEQDLASGISPLGSTHQECVNVATELVFRNIGIPYS